MPELHKMPELQMPELQKKNDVIASMFFSAAIVMIFTQFAGVIANIIDGIITSHYLGPDAYSAVSLFGPMASTILLVAGLVSTGGQIVFSQKVGQGRTDEANSVFTFSIAAGAAIAVFFILLSLIAPGVMFRICGVSLSKRPELYGHMLEYLRGYMIGIPALILTQILGPFLVVDNSKSLVSASAAVLCAVDIAGDLLNAEVFHGGVFGMGLATSLALWMQLLVQAVHLIGRSSTFRFTLKSLTKQHLKDIAVNGGPAFARKLATILRDLMTNWINLFVAVSTAAVAAKGMQSDLNMLMFCIGIGIGKVLVTMSSMFYGANDKEGLKRVFRYSVKLCLIFAGVAGAVIFIAAPFISRLYTSDPEVIDLSVFSIRCMAASLILDTMSVAYQDYLHGIGNRKMVNILTILERLVITVITALVLGLLFGSKGIMASIAVSKVILMILIFVYLCVRCKGIPKSTEDFMFLPEGFGGKAEDHLSAQIRSIDDVMKASEDTRQFCKNHGVDDKRSNLMALFVEELAGNIISHGKVKPAHGLCADFRLYADGGNIGMSIRDYCKTFNTLEYYEKHANEDPISDSGIRIVVRLAKEIRYINTFNSNCVLVYLEKEE